MKTSIYAITAIAAFFASASAAPEAKPAISTFDTPNGRFHGESLSMLEKRDCTNCVGSHGKCTIGEGNCYAPEGCYFCGGCTASQARCQNPKKEGCQCYAE